MSELNTPLPSFPGRQALVAALGALCLLAVLVAPAAAADEFVPLNSAPETLAALDVQRHVPGISPDATYMAEGLQTGRDAGLYRHVSRHFKFGLRYAWAVFALVPEEAPQDDHYVFLNLVGML